MVRNCRWLSRSAAKPDRAARPARRCRPRPDRAAARRSAPARVSPGGGMSTSSRARNTSVPNTRRIGCAKLPAVYWVERAADRESRSPRPARAARRASAKRWIDVAGERGRERDEQEHEQAVVGAAALGDRHERQPGHRRLHRHARRRPAPCTTGASASITRPGQDAGQQAQAGEREHRGEREAVDLVRALGRRRCAAGRGR